MRKSSKNSEMRVLKHGKEYIFAEEETVICPECFVGRVRRCYFASGDKEIRRRGLFFDTILEQKQYICEGCGCEFSVETRKKGIFTQLLLGNF